MQNATKSHSKSFYKGRKAFAKPDAYNPYDSVEDFEDYREWDRGYNEAYFRNLDKQKVIEKRKRKLQDKR